MTFTYTDPSNSTLEAIRFYCQDTQSADAFLTDEEITFLIDQWSNVSDNPIYLASVACESIASKFAREISYSADGVSIGSAELQNKYIQLGQSLRALWKASDVGAGPDVGGILIGETFDDDVKPLFGGVGIHDNPSAGQQDYGGTESQNYVSPERGGP